jgi:hypothetical protein
LVAAIAALSTWSGGAAAQVTDEASRAATAYRTALDAAEKGQPGAVEHAFGLLDELRREFVDRSAGQSESILERLPEDRFARLQQELRGAIVFRE